MGTSWGTLFVERLRDVIHVGVESVGVDVQRDGRASVAELALYHQHPAAFACWVRYWLRCSSTGAGAFCCRGGFHRLADALAGALVDHGGELLLDHQVERIQFDGNRVRGVTLDSSREITSGAGAIDDR